MSKANKTKETNYYVTGMPYPNDDGTYTFQLVKPSYSDLPYITDNQDCTALRTSGKNGTALYLVDVNNGELTKVHNKNYEKRLVEPTEKEKCPDKVKMPKDMLNKVSKAITTYETYLPY